jgi:beta-lactamase regulating signal transducer with metallopeptidase domain
VSLDLALRAAALLAVGTALGWALRSTSAAARHALWHVTVVATLALPLTALVSPAWSISSAVRGAVDAGTERSALAVSTLDPASAAAHARGETARAAMGRASDVWLAGSAVVALYFLSGFLWLWVLRRRGQPAPPAWSADVARLSARTGLSREVDVLVVSGISSPLVTGLRRPAVLIPPVAAAWSDARRIAVLVHELAHVRRRDLAAQLAAQSLATMHWFNPLAWHAAKEMRRERELACDVEVLRAGVAPVAYATDLVAIAIAGSTRRLPSAGLSMARPSDLESRIVTLLARPSCRASRAVAVPVALLVLGASMIVAGAQVTPSGPAVDPTPRPAGWSILPSSLGTDPPPAEATDTSSSDARARERAALLLGLTGGNEVVPSLLQALEDPDARVREKAAVGLAWRRDERVGPALVDAADDPSPVVREKVLVALAFSGEPRAAALIDAARSDPDARVRDKARALQGVAFAP